MGGIVRRIILFSFAISKAEDHRHRLGRVVAKLGRRFLLRSLRRVEAL
jgi:hypothetical protein